MIARKEAARSIAYGAATSYAQQFIEESNDNVPPSNVIECLGDGGSLEILSPDYILAVHHRIGLHD